LADGSGGWRGALAGRNFFDAIDIQAKVLRAIDERSFRRVGGRT